MIYLIKKSSKLIKVLKELRSSKTGMIGLGIVCFFVILSLYVPFAVPISEAQRWNNLDSWLDNPPSMPPLWIEPLTGKKLPKNTIIEEFTRNVSVVGRSKVIELRHTLDVSFDSVPSSIILNYNVTYRNQPPVMQVTWKKPNGDTLVIFNDLIRSSGSAQRLYLSTDAEVKRKLASYVQEKIRKPVDHETVDVEAVLYSKDGEGMQRKETATVDKGRYSLVLRLTAFDPRDDFETVRMAVGGRIFGAFGTDAFRRDLTIGILWGAPVALSVALSVAIISTLIGILLGVISGFFGGSWKDEVTQRLTDFMLLLPVLPILILISLAFRIDLLQLVVWLTVFGWMGITKITRSVALQIREEFYIDAARSLGESDLSIILKHVFPQILPYTFAVIALSVPGVIFTEAALSFLGLGDPQVVTWGKILHDAQLSGAAVSGYWWWIVIPGLLIVFLGMGFGLLGNSLDRILNPQLKKR